MNSVPLTDLQIAKLVERYVRERDRAEKMAATVTRHLSARLTGEAIQHVPTFRSKSPESLKGKLERKREVFQFRAFESDFAPSILDLAGVRILLYRPSDLKPACAVIDDLFEIPRGERFRKDFIEPAGYQARHRVVRLPNDMIGADPALANLVDVVCEVQVVGLANHIYNELEHDIRYKTPTGEPSSEQGVLLEELRGRLSAVQQTVRELMEVTERRKAEDTAIIESPEALRQSLQERCGRDLRGDHLRLLRLLDGVLREVTPAALYELPLGPEDLTAASELLRRLDLAIDEDDLRLVVAALFPLYGPDFVEVVWGWSTLPGPISRFVRVLDRACQEGRM